jgi:hypothetical protein
MRPVVTQPRQVPAGAKARTLALLASGVLVAIAFAAMTAADSPGHVERVTVDNPHEWAANVDVAGIDKNVWVGLGTVDRQTTHTLEEVLDQGRQWRFRFSYGGAEGGEVAISRSELERKGWRVEIPDTFEERMRAAGLAPSGG